MPSNSNYQFGSVPGGLVDYVKDKGKSSKAYFNYLLARTQQMFAYKNLPDTIEADILEYYLQVNGICCITEAKGKLFAFNGSLGGKQDVYYRSTRFIIANPHISQLGPDESFSKECIVLGDEEHDGVLMRNDSLWIGLTPLIARYASLMAENCVTVRVADIMLRIIAMISAPTDKTEKAAQAYLAKIEKGELGVIGDSAFIDNAVKMQSPPSNNGSYLTQFIELQQYYKGSFYNELGLRANYNMKREAIGEGESSLDEDATLPFCDNMLKCRREDIAKVNDMFGLNISVDFNSSWLKNALDYNLSVLSQLEPIGAMQVGESTGDEVELGQDAESMGQDESTGESDVEIEDDGEIGTNEEVAGDDSEVAFAEAAEELVEELIENMEVVEPSQLGESEDGDEDGEEDEENDTEEISAEDEGNTSDN